MEFLLEKTFAIFHKIILKYRLSLNTIKFKTFQEIKFSHGASVLYIGVDRSVVIYISLNVKLSIVLSLFSQHISVIVHT